MRTYKGIAELSFKVVVPDQTVADFRAACQQEDATPFMRLTQERHPVNDDEFMQAFVSNAIRRTLRNALAEELHQANMGGTVSPATIEIVACVPDHDAPVTPQVVDVQRKLDPTAVLQPLNKDHE